MDKVLSLGEALPAEQQRVRELIPLYAAIPTGAFAVAIMQAALTRAEQATAAGDIVGMARAYEELKGFKE